MPPRRSEALHLATLAQAGGSRQNLRVKGLAAALAPLAEMFARAQGACLTCFGFLDECSLRRSSSVAKHWNSSADSDFIWLPLLQSSYPGLEAAYEDRLTLTPAKAVYQQMHCLEIWDELCSPWPPSLACAMGLHS